MKTENLRKTFVNKTLGLYLQQNWTQTQTHTTTICVFILLKSTFINELLKFWKIQDLKRKFENHPQNFPKKLPSNCWDTDKWEKTKNPYNQSKILQRDCAISIHYLLKCRLYTQVQILQFIATIADKFVYYSS